MYSYSIHTNYEYISSSIICDLWTGLIHISWTEKNHQSTPDDDYNEMLKYKNNQFSPINKKILTPPKNCLKSQTPFLATDKLFKEKVVLQNVEIIAEKLKRNNKNLISTPRIAILGFQLTKRTGQL